MLDARRAGYTGPQLEEYDDWADILPTSRPARGNPRE